jgi:superfamily II DNA/RNA helicase
VTPISKFNISEQTVRKLAEKGIHHLFPIQAATFEFCYAVHNPVTHLCPSALRHLSVLCPRSSE